MTSGRRAAVWRWLPVVVYAAVIFYFSSRSGRELPRWSFMRHDKLLHAAEYTGFAFLLARAYRRGAWLAVVTALLFAVTDEYHQTFVPGRSGNDLGDLTADLVGATLGALLWLGRTRLLRRRAGDGTKSA